MIFVISLSKKSADALGSRLVAVVRVVAVVAVVRVVAVVHVVAVVRVVAVVCVVSVIRVVAVAVNKIGSRLVDPQLL